MNNQTLRKYPAELEIKRQIYGLLKMKEFLPFVSALGTPNHKIIDTQVSILQLESVPDDYYISEHSDEFTESDFEIYCAANDAQDWLFGYYVDDLFENNPEETSDFEKHYDPEDIASKIDIPLTAWPGNCYGIAYNCLKNGIVDGKLRYGHFLGKIHPKSTFYNNSKMGFCQHAWIELSDGRIFDPTRWAFDMKDPYIYVGYSDDLYDIGGNLYRSSIFKDAPEYDETKRQVHLQISTDELLSFIQNLLKDSRNSLTFDIAQVHFLANQSPQMLGKYAKEIYEMLKSIGRSALIPLDNWNFVME